MNFSEPNKKYSQDNRLNAETISLKSGHGAI